MTPLPQELLDLKASISIAIHNDDCTSDEKEVAAKALDTLVAGNAELRADRDRLLPAAKVALIVIHGVECPEPDIHVDACIVLREAIRER